VSSVAQDHCRNCDAQLTQGQVFCAHCGQKAYLNKLTIREIVGDFLHELVHVDRSALSLVRMLLLRPGYVARDYVDGRRKRYFGPFAFLVVIASIAAAAIALSGLVMTASKTVPIGGPPTPTDAARNAAALSAVAIFLQRHINATILLETPLLAAFNRLMFRKDGTNFAEQLVVASYTSGMRSLSTTIIVIPCAFICRQTGTDPAFIYITAVLVWFAYFGLAAHQFSPDHGLTAGIKGALAAALTWCASQIVFTLITMGFVMYFLLRA
jgi:hypothetical protein